MFSPSTNMSMLNTNKLRYKKNLLNLGSPCMYPMEYRWINDPMPVTNSAIVIDSGSARKARSTLRLPAGIQLNRVCTCARSSVVFESKSMNTPTVTKNADAVISVAT